MYNFPHLMYFQTGTGPISPNQKSKNRCLRSSRLWMVYKKFFVLKKFTQFTEKRPCWSLILNKVASLAQVLSCEFSEIVKNNFLAGHLRLTTSDVC